MAYNHREYQRKYMAAYRGKLPKDHPDCITEKRQKIRDYQREYRICNKDVRRKYLEENKEKIKKQKSEYHKKNKAKANQRSKDWYAKNKEKKIAYVKKHAKKFADIHNKQRRERYRNDPAYRIEMLQRTRITKAIKKGGGVLELIGCSIDELKKHIESKFQPWMTWENHGKYTWHIDHIIPCAFFDLSDPEQQKQCFHYTNLQPLPAKENHSKGGRIITPTKISIPP